MFSIRLILYENTHKKTKYLYNFDTKTSKKGFYYASDRLWLQPEPKKCIWLRLRLRILGFYSTYLLDFRDAKRQFWLLFV